MQPRFIHLRLHTEYSLVDSVIRVPELMQQLEAMHMPAVALTDQSNMFALVNFTIGTGVRHQAHYRCGHVHAGSGG